MIEFYIFVFLCFNLLFPISVQSANVSDISGEGSKDVQHAIKLDSGKAQPLRSENKSFYDSECNCGFGSSGCSYLDGEKICRCDWQYVQNNDKCERCYCGIFANKCYFENNKKMCSCFGSYKQNSLGECAECDCGYNAESCNFSGYTKVCTCRDGYIVEYGKCERCDCGPKSISCDLTIDKYTRCKCEPGYVADRSRWEMDEQCKLPGVNGWRIATYIESVCFALIIIVCTISICYKKVSE